jgi:hypothetical protein
MKELSSLFAENQKNCKGVWICRGGQYKPASKCAGFPNSAASANFMMPFGGSIRHALNPTENPFDFTQLRRLKIRDRRKPKHPIIPTPVPRDQVSKTRASMQHSTSHESPANNSVISSSPTYKICVFLWDQTSKSLVPR